MNISNINSLLSIPGIKLRTSMIFGIIIFTALMAFEVFNYSSTEFALHDLLGEIRFAGLRWATILAIAFCGIDFAGIARLFTPSDEYEARETWYLFGAWLLAATMNAMLTWWGVSMAIANHTMQSTAIIDAATVSRAVPVFVAILVWLIRILIIGTISVAADHLINPKVVVQPERRPASAHRSNVPAPSPANALQPRPSFSRAESARNRANTPARPEPVYTSMSSEERSYSPRGSVNRPRS